MMSLLSVYLKFSFLLKLLNLNYPYVVDIHRVSLQYQNTTPFLVKIQVKIISNEDNHSQQGLNGYTWVQLW
jgi:hypothetical protein